MSLLDLGKPYTGLLVEAAQFFGRAAVSRVVAPALICVSAIFMTLAVSAVVLPRDGPTEQALFGLDDLAILFVVTLAIALVVFWGISRWLFGTLLHFLLVTTQLRNSARSKEVRTVLRFYRNLNTVGDEINCLGQPLRSERDQLAAERDKWDSAHSGALETIQSINRDANKMRRWRRLALELPWKWYASFRLKMSQRALAQFNRSQEDSGWGRIVANALNDAARALARINGTVADIDQLLSKMPLPGEDTEYEELVEHLNGLNLKIKELCLWRKRLLQAPLRADDLRRKFTLGDVELIKQSSALEEISKAARDRDSLLVIQIVAITGYLRKATLARGCASASSLDYWVDRWAKVRPPGHLPSQSIVKISAVDRFRKAAMWYATLVLGLIVAAPLVFVTGMTLSERHWPLWLLLTVATFALCLLPWRWLIWTTVVVVRREREIARELIQEAVRW